VPIRCFTCGKMVADKYDYYIQEVQKLEKKQSENEGKAKTKKAAAEAHATRHFDPIHTGTIMDKLGLTRYCCRRMLLGTEDMMDKI
jgi:DNA-directed RNA polymerase subunit N (RpoN/RPB10)